MTSVNQVRSVFQKVKHFLTQSNFRDPKQVMAKDIYKYCIKCSHINYLGTAELFLKVRMGKNEIRNGEMEGNGSPSDMRN